MRCKKMVKNGWTILRFFESDIKENIKKCMKIIEKTIKIKAEENQEPV